MLGEELLHRPRIIVEGEAPHPLEVRRREIRDALSSHGADRTACRRRADSPTAHTMLSGGLWSPAQSRDGVPLR
jgi:hypothetical protein